MHSTGCKSLLLHSQQKSCVKVSPPNSPCTSEGEPRVRLTQKELSTGKCHTRGKCSPGMETAARFWGKPQSCSLRQASSLHPASALKHCPSPSHRVVRASVFPAITLGKRQKIWLNLACLHETLIFQEIKEVQECLMKD